MILYFWTVSILFFSPLTQFWYWLNKWIYMLEGPCRVIEMICNPFSENASYQYGKFNTYWKPWVNKIVWSWNCLQISYSVFWWYSTLASWIVLKWTIFVVLQKSQNLTFFWILGFIFMWFINAWWKISIALPKSLY